MSWARIDDNFPDNIKIAPLSDAAFRAHVTAICYAARNLTDGFIPDKKAREFAGRPRVVQELVPHLWEPKEGGYFIHDYLTYNSDRATILAEREKAKTRMNNARSSRNVRPNIRPNIGGNSPNPTPTPNPIPMPIDEVGEIARAFAQFGNVTAGTVQAIEYSVQDHGAELVAKAVRQAASAGFEGAPPWSYVESTIERLKAQGGPDERISEARHAPRRGARVGAAAVRDSSESWANDA